MHSIFLSSLSLLAATSSVSALAIPKRSTSLPFNQIVSFGDELSDNGDGSFGHGITPDPYGYKTWTDGPVAVTYLAYNYGVDLRGFAFGASNGGGDFGATIDNDYTPAVAQYNGAPVPSVHQQVQQTYVAHPSFANIKNSLSFIWVGQNDLSKHTDAFWEGDPQNSAFGDAISSKILAEAEFLASHGAPHVFVANIYPKHLAPVTKQYLCKTDDCVTSWGKVIQDANTKIQQALAGSKYSKQFIYYDAFKFISDAYNNRASLGYTDDRICDGSGSDKAWSDCIAGKQVWDGAKTHFWFDFIQPETTVNLLIANDMKKTIDSALGLY